jgi:chromosome partitioning protein
MIVLIGGEKGGTGKSTIATNLAAIHAISKKEVLLLDTDSQASATYWAALRDDREGVVRVPCLRKTGNKIHRELDKLRAKFDTIIIDAGGRDSGELRSSMLVADRFYIPIRPSQFDAWTIEKIDTLVDEAQIINEGLAAHAFLNLASTNPQVSESDEAREYIRGFVHLVLADSIIRDRIAFRKAAKEGLSVVEMDDPKAKAEIMALYNNEVFA